MTDGIEEYIMASPHHIQEKLYQIKAVIEEAIPEATSRIAWNMPTYSIGKANIIHFSVQKKFITLHVGISAINFFRERLAGYSTTKSTIHLKFDAEIPAELIRKIISYNLFELQA
ncbi:iron chaperone [Enterococcus pallens]|uniref:YdhG-like domain-containing protein n=1 Tax=Enterococcus pallens ATCC BAA-351 TaxID=1158607 RepID=R2Q9C8_9ENTE|nr:DUF1801 domain-containing protein [Enterococcus pallens]EOH93037.1 hypothetical protein UAU_02679 [Enterococcus pallens ATCC BAA-351]EOU24823.1 hypothetical protein I588_00810 [Enterococcus pallens ATCC BAA-351]OJG76277.1 hypothetical protein RV10_GL003883 [Enterococcus pallens]